MPFHFFLRSAGRREYSRKERKIRSFKSLKSTTKTHPVKTCLVLPTIHQLGLQGKGKSRKIQSDFHLLQEISVYRGEYNPHSQSFFPSMFNPICRNSSTQLRAFLEIAPINRLHFCSLTPNSSPEHSFTVSHLIKSCGLPPDVLLPAPKISKFGTLDRADSVLAFFKKHGFTKIQILDLVIKFPPILSCHPDKTLLPKVDFFASIGYSGADIAHVVAATPSIFKCSLEKLIIPTFKFYWSLFQSDERTSDVIRRLPLLLAVGLKGYPVRNMQILRDLGVPESNIVDLLGREPTTFMCHTDEFGKVVEEIQQMGVNPLKVQFVWAIYVRRKMGKWDWEKKVDVYMKWGWSKDEIVRAFRNHPFFMLVHRDKITGIMDFLIKKNGLKPSGIAKMPEIMTSSLEKRIVPRSLIYQVVLEKGLLKKNDIGLDSFLGLSENQFTSRIRRYYKKNAPELLQLYRRILDLAK